MAIFVDITDLYYKLLKKFGSGKLDYRLYLERTNDTGSKYAYGCQEENEAGPFIKHLRSSGFITKYKRPYTLKIGDRKIKRCNWLVGVAVDVFKELDNQESRFVFGTSNPDIIPLIKLLKERCCHTSVFACNIPESLKKLSDYTEITEDILEDDKTIQRS